MPSDKKIEAALKVFLDAWPYIGSRELVTLMLNAAEQAEPATNTLIDTISDEVWNHDASKDNCMVIDKNGLTEPAPVARSGAVKGRKELIQKYAAPINADVPDRVMRRHLSEFLDEALAALEPAEPAVMCVGCEGKPSLGNSPCAVCGKQAAEPARDVEPYTYFYRYSDPMSGKPVWRSSGGLWNGQRPSETLPLFTRPPESRLREALEEIVGKDSYIDASPRGDRAIIYGDFAKIARSALAQEDGR